MIIKLLNIQSPINYYLILWVSIIIILLFLLFILSVLFISQKRILQNKKNLNSLKQNFEKELLKTKIEIQEQTFQEISSELHDNIGQVLSYLKLSLSITDNKSNVEIQNKLLNAKHLINQLIIDVRNLHKTLSYQNIIKLGLCNIIKEEVERINNDQLFIINLKVLGENYLNNSEVELVIFRIFQESLNNILKHAKAKNVTININFNSEYFEFRIEDDGVGFNFKEVILGSGLNNIINRAKLINADIKIISQPLQGTSISLKINHG